MKKKLIVLSGNGTPAIAAANIYFSDLKGNWDVLLVEETNMTFAKIFKIIRNRFVKKGFISCIDMVLGRLYCMVFDKGTSVEKSYQAKLTVDSMNGAEVLNFIKEQKPDAIVTNGCSLLTKKFLSQISCPIVNVHNGVAPRYRGSGNLWAFRERNPELVGVTVHLIDAGIDTGERLAVQKIAYDGSVKFSDIDRVAFQHGAKIVVQYLETGYRHIPEEFKNLCDGVYSFAGLSDWFFAKRYYLKFRQPGASGVGRLEDVFLESFEKNSHSEKLSTLQKLHWHDDASCKERDDTIKALYDKYATPEWEVLDIGCGDGRYKEFLSPKKYIGCDYFVEEANKGFIIQCSAESLPFENSSVDCSVGVGLFQHVSRSQRVGDEMRRVTRPGGFIILNTLRQFSLFELLVIGSAFFWSAERVKLVWTIFRRDYFSGKAIDGVLVARRYSTVELLSILKKSNSDVVVKYNGILGTRLFAREITMLVKN